MRHKLRLAWAIVTLLTFAAVNASGSRSETQRSDDTSSRDEQRLARFEKQADELRTLLKIPGLSAVIIKDQKVLWAKGFGFADVENQIGRAHV